LGGPRADIQGATPSGRREMAKYRKLMISLGWLAALLMAAGAEWKL
jgi:hypothetical protein